MGSTFKDLVFFVKPWLRSLKAIPIYSSIVFVFVLMGWSLMPNALQPFKIYCAPLNLDIRTWICRLAQSPSQRTCIQDCKWCIVLKTDSYKIPLINLNFTKRKKITAWFEVVNTVAEIQHLFRQSGEHCHVPDIDHLFNPLKRRKDQQPKTKQNKTKNQSQKLLRNWTFVLLLYSASYRRC